MSLQSKNSWTQWVHIKEWTRRKNTLPQCVHISRASCRQSFVALTIWLLFSGVVAAQNHSPVTAGSEMSLPTAIGTPLKVAFPGVPNVPAVKPDNAVQPASSRGPQGFPEVESAQQKWKQTCFGLSSNIVKRTPN
jgi:hypothetical protein